MTAPTCAICGICGRPMADQALVDPHCTAKAGGDLRAIAQLAPDARLVAAGLVRRGDGAGGSNKPGSRPPLNDGATDALDAIYDVLARTCLHIAVQRGMRFQVPCLPSCVKPSPSQAHCASCHETFGGITGFDRHRRDGQCLTPADIGYTADPNGVYRAPMTESGKARLTALRGSRAAETHPSVPTTTPDTPEVAESLSGSQS